ncbi:WD40 repeat-like protein, partial [Ceraceosorus guamensis]
MELPPSTAAAARVGVNIQVAHSHGLTRVKYAPSGSKVSWLFTGGDEGTVRLLPTDPRSGAEALAIDDATAPINWIDADADYLVAAAADGAVRIYQHNVSLSEDGAAATDLVGILTRTGLPARCAALERHVLPTKTPRVACLSDDLVIKVVDSGAPQRVQLLAKHSRPPKAAAWSPVEPLLITTDCDGVACIWDMQGAEPVHVKAMERILAQARPESEYSSEPVWHPSGNSFVLPSKTHEVVMVEKPSWNVSTSFSAPARDQLPPGVESPSGQISALSFSPNGRYLAVATASAHVTVWETATRKPLRQRSAYALVTGISWHPEADALAWTDAQGQLSRWWEVVGSANANPFELLDYQHRSTEQTLKERVRQQQVTEDIDALFDGAGLSDEDEETEAMLDKEELNDDLNDFVVDDDGGGTGYGAATDRRSRTQRTTGLTQRHVGRSHSSLISSTKMQSAFQPTSTDLRGQRRYFAYSCLGSLVGTDQGDHQTIAFESSDAGSRRNWRFADHFGYNMASLGGSGALFAYEDDAESGHPSSIFFKPFEASGARTTLATEWTVNLPRGEEAVAIAMAGKAPRPNADSRAADAMTISSAIVATSAGYLRFFSASGFQRYLWALGSPVVSMAAGTHSAMIVHRGATSCALEGFQNLSYTLINLLTFSIQQQGVLPLAKDATLRWVGLNDADVPAFFDSRGVLYLLDRSHAPHGQARWVPCLDTKNIQAQQASKTDSSLAPRLHYWPVGLTSHKLLAIILKGAHSTPDPSASSRPLLQDLDLHFPLAAGEGPAAALEQEHARNAFLADSIRSARRARALELELDEDEEPDDDDSPDPWVLQHNADKALLQLIQLACKADRHARALDAAMELHSEKTLDAAVQIATFFHQPGLADRMENLRGWVRGRRERDE